MIAAVRGEVMVRRPDHVVIDAGGVGYRLAVSAETLKAVPAIGGETFLPQLSRYPNVLVGRTFSKAYGLAGMRVGIVIGQPPRPVSICTAFI